MSYYTGDIAGEFIWEYEQDGVFFRHVQDPFLLEKYGGILDTNVEWEGCHCFVHDNNLPYCMDCYNSVEEHRAVANSEDLKSKTPSYEMRLFRDDFYERVRPWLEANEAVAREDLKHLAFSVMFDCVHYDEWECTHTSSNFNIVQEYCLLKQIEYYFDYFEDHEFCLLYIH
jgi:hypothetical protein